MKNNAFSICLSFIIMLGFLQALAGIGYTATVTLEWDPSESDITGYKLYYGTATGDYNQVTDVGNVTTYQVSGLEDGVIYFAVTAYDTEETESNYSNEIRVRFVDGLWVNEPSIADAGPDQTVDVGVTVTLDGSNSNDPDGDIQVYLWEQTGGVQVTLSDPKAVRPDFIAPDVGLDGESLTFQLTVTDQSGLQSTDTCVVNITWDNDPPTANAGPDQTVDEGVVVTLNGSSSLDIDDGIASYSWTQISGPMVTLSDSTSLQPTFTTPNVGPEGESLTFNLTVTDTGGLQDTDSCIVNISWQNEPPIAFVAKEYIEAHEGTIVTLDGSGSTDADDGISSYLWTQVDGDPVTLSNSTSDVTIFTAPETDQYGSNLSFKLTVTDFGGLQGTANCSVFVWQNESPTVIITSPPDGATFTSGDVVSLAGSANDPEDGNLTANLVWTSSVDGQIGTGGNFSSALSVGTHTITASVQDSDNASGNDSVSVTITPENNHPQANAGEDQVVYEDDVVILDGSRSSDPDGEIASYQWTQISGTSVTLSDPGSALPTFIAPDVGPDGGILTFSLTVTDNGGLQGTDTCYVTVSSEIQTDNVTITSATYIGKRRKLRVKAVSDAPAGSVTLTAFANYGTESVKLGNLKYSAKKKVYRKTFRRINSAPDTVTVTSSGGGSDTKQCLIK